MTVPPPADRRPDPAAPEGESSSQALDSASAAGTDQGVAPAEQGAHPPIDRALLDRIFGTVLPETTRDERDDERPSGGSDDWYRQNRPPHHG